MQGWTTIFVVFMLFGGAGVVQRIFQNMGNTRLEIAKLRAQQADDQGLKREVEDLRAEMKSLKQNLLELSDTATQYDLSFDTALQRMERRIEFVEQRQAQNQDQQQEQRIGR